MALTYTFTLTTPTPDVDITADVLPGSYISYGIREYGPQARVARPLEGVLYLDNSAENVHSTLGYYNISSSGVFYEDIISLDITDGVDTRTYPLFIDEIDPDYGQKSPRVARVKVSDDRLTAIYIPVNDDYGVELDKTEDYAAYATLPALVENPLTFPLVFHTLGSKATGAAKAQAACESAFGYIYIPYSKNGTYKVVVNYVQRSKRGGEANYAAEFNESMSTLTMPSKSSDMIMNWYFSFNEAEVDSTATNTLWTLNHEITLDAGETKTIKARFTSPDTAAKRVLGQNIVTSLVANTHYRMSSTAGDDASDANGDLSVTLTPSNGTDASEYAEWDLQNTGSATGYVNLLKVVGRGIYVYETEQTYKQVNLGLTNFAATKNFTIPYWHSAAWRDEIITLYSNYYSYTRGAKNAELTYWPTKNSTLEGYFMDSHIGAFVKVSETIKDVNTYAIDEFYIQSEKIEFKENKNIFVTLGLDPLPPEANYLYQASDGTYYQTSDGEGYYARYWIE